jgi:hypothetical protein
MAFQPSGAPSGKHHEGIAYPRCVWSQTPDLRPVSGRSGCCQASRSAYLCELHRVAAHAHCTGRALQAALTEASIWSGQPWARFGCQIGRWIVRRGWRLVGARQLRRGSSRYGAQHHPAGRAGDDRTCRERTICQSNPASLEHRRRRSRPATWRTGHRSYCQPI